MNKEKLKLNAHLTKWKFHSQDGISSLINIDQIYIDYPNNSAFITSNIYDYILFLVKNLFYNLL